MRAACLIRANPRGIQRAQALVWLTLAVPLFVSMAGLAIDGGVLLDARRELQSVTDGAARAGATQLDMQRLRTSAGTDIQLDPAAANFAAQDYFSHALLQSSHAWRDVAQADVEVGQRRVHVLAHARVQPAFLRIVGIEDVAVEAGAFADVQFGIRDGAGD